MVTGRRCAGTWARATVGGRSADHALGEELAIGKRQVQAGEVAVRKTVDTEHVTERVPVRREEVTVERRPVSAADTRSAEIAEDRIVVPVTEEEVVVEKRPVVKEEVVLRTRTVEDTEEVEADLRRERIDVDERGAQSRPAPRSTRRSTRGWANQTLVRDDRQQGGIAARCSEFRERRARSANGAAF
jgi:uncharacterized protein (TIGR02271 family)